MSFRYCDLLTGITPCLLPLLLIAFRLGETSVGQAGRAGASAFVLWQTFESLKALDLIRKPMFSNIAGVSRLHSNKEKTHRKRFYMMKNNALWRGVHIFRCKYSIFSRCVGFHLVEAVKPS